MAASEGGDDGMKRFDHHRSLFARARQGERGSAVAAGRGADDPAYTIADVAKACGLPQPVIAQVVPRTWTKHGWMYTGEQLQNSIEIAQEMRSQTD